jgi:hypothetical protein
MAGIIRAAIVRDKKNLPANYAKTTKTITKSTKHTKSTKKTKETLRGRMTNEKTDETNSLA